MTLLFEEPLVDLPAGIHACSTTRVGGKSAGEFSSFNLAMHVGDDEGSVLANRMVLRETLGLPSEPAWLNQVHSNRIALVGDADGSFTSAAGKVLCVQTADCLPVLIWDCEGMEIAAVHAGWQGLQSGVIENAIASFRSRDLVAWIGPHIQSCHYEVDRKLFELFKGYDRVLTKGRDSRHWQLDLGEVARQQMEATGAVSVVLSAACTFCDSLKFFSYRRDGRCGRMASLIWRA